VSLLLLVVLHSLAQQLTIPIDAAKTAGIYEITKSWSSSVGDYNNDGWPDIFLSRHYAGGARLYKNDHGHFVEAFPGTFPAKEKSGYLVDRHHCAWGDANRDGLPDLYCTKGGDYGSGVIAKENELWIQQPNSGGFVNEAEKYGVTDPWGRGRFCAFIDVNHDGFDDLFVANEAGRSDGQDSRNHLFINQGGAYFRSAPEYGLDTLIGGGQCVRTPDVDADGWDDLLVCSHGSYPRLYHNNKGRSFTDISVQAGLSNQGYWRDVIVKDIDNDGYLDLAMVRSGRFQVQLQRDGVFQPPISMIGLSAGEKLAAGDVNKDGLLDIYVCQGGIPSSGINLTYNPYDLMLINQGGAKFVKAIIPQAWQGQGEHVSAIDFDRDGKTDFVVLNGFGSLEGSVQLIKFP